MADLHSKAVSTPVTSSQRKATQVKNTSGNSSSSNSSSSSITSSQRQKASDSGDITIDQVVDNILERPEKTDELEAKTSASPVIEQEVDLRGYTDPLDQTLAHLKGLREAFDKKISESLLSVEHQIPHYYEKEKILILPSEIYEEDNVVGAMLYNLSEALGYKTKFYKGKAELADKFDEKFVIGLWFGTESNKIVRLNRSKQSYELGKAHAFAQRVKAFFGKHSHLGEQALEHDQFFFGNNPNEKDAKNQVVSFDLKSRFKALFKADMHADKLYSVWLHLVNVHNLTAFSDEDIDKIILAHVIKIDDIVRRSFRSTYSKRKGKLVIAAVTKPNLPTRSPLFMQGEMDLIRGILSPFWNSLEDIKSMYLERIFSHGFSALAKEIMDIYQLRWGILSKFAKQTTHRLQDIRKMLGNDKLKKQDILMDNVAVYVKNRQGKVQDFISEMIHIIPEGGLYKAVLGLNKGSPVSTREAGFLLSAEAAAMYNRAGLEIKEKITLTKDVLLLDDISAAVNKLSGLVTKIGTINHARTIVTVHSLSKLPGRVVHYKGQYDNLREYINSFRNLSIEALAYAGYALEPPIKDPSTFLSKEVMGQEKAHRALIVHIETMAKYASGQEKTILTAALNNLKS